MRSSRRTLFGPALALVAVALGVELCSAAYPIPPVPLRQLASQADVVALVRVEAVEMQDRPVDPPVEPPAETPRASKRQQPSPKPKPPQDPVAQLLIVEVLKGDLAPNDRISIPFMYLICPEPPRYVAGETTLVFLQRVGKDGPLRTCSLSYGTKNMDDLETRKAYLDATREIIRIAKIEDMFDRDRQTVEWLVRCVETPCTRWDGAFDLERGSDPYDIEQAQKAAAGDKDARRRLDRRGFFPDNLLAQTTGEQRNRIRTVAKSLKRDDRNHYQMKRLVDRIKTPR